VLPSHVIFASSFLQTFRGGTFGRVAVPVFPIVIYDDPQAITQLLQARHDAGLIEVVHDDAYLCGGVRDRLVENLEDGAARLETHPGERFIIEDLGIHTLDIARFLLGDVKALTARTKRVNPQIKGEDVATILLDHESGMTSIVDVSYATKLGVEPFPETSVEIDGSDAQQWMVGGHGRRCGRRRCNGHGAAGLSV